LTVRGTWQIKITRLDGTEFKYTEHRARAPQRGEIIENPAGHRLRARIESVTELPAQPGAVGLGIWQVNAQEI